MRALAIVTVVAVGLCVGGCTSISYGPMTIRSFGTDVGVESASWVRGATATQPSEALTIVGGKKKTDVSVHTLGNVSMAMIGAIIGSSAGPAGTATGAASGAGVAEAWQTLSDWLNKNKPPSQVPAPTVTAATVPTSTTATGSTVGTPPVAAPVESVPVAPDPSNVIPDYSGPWGENFIPKDKGREILTEMNGMQIRLSANDAEKLHCGGSWYALDHISLTPDAFAVNQVGTDLVATGHDFVSVKTGGKYRFMGWTVNSSANPIQKVYQIVVPKSDQHDALRAYWATVP